MRECPRSRFEDEYGCIDGKGFALMHSGVPEYPEVIAWEKEYASECDRLATLEAVKTGKRHWGRWYLNAAKPISLDTRTSTPGIDGSPNSPKRRGYVYDIALDGVSVHYKKHSHSWIRHMEEKNWMGEQGLADLQRAFDTLIGEGAIKED